MKCYFSDKAGLKFFFIRQTGREIPHIDKVPDTSVLLKIAQNRSNKY